MPVVWSLEATISMRYDETGKVIGCGVSSPNTQGWHPLVNHSYVDLASFLFPRTLPRAAMRLAKTAQREKAKKKAK